MQAAIAALHARAARPEETDWAEIDLLYATLERLQPSPVVTLNRAVASPRCAAPRRARLVEPLEAQLSGYFHFFGVKGALLMQLGRADEARIAFDRAIALANTAAEAAHIRMHLDRLAKDSAPAEIPAQPSEFPGARKFLACDVGPPPSRPSLGKHPIGRSETWQPKPARLQGSQHPCDDRRLVERALRQTGGPRHGSLCRRARPLHAGPAAHSRG